MTQLPLNVLLISAFAKDTNLQQKIFSALQEPGVTLHHATDLNSALTLIAKTSFDVALMTLSLPDSDGLASFTRVYAAAPALPILVIAGLSEESLAIEALRAGAQDYLTQPELDSPLLPRTIHRAIERKRAVAVLQASEKRFRALFEEFKDVTYSTGESGIFVDINQSALNLFGYTKEEMIGMDARQLYVDPQDRDKLIVLVNQKGSVRDFEVKLKKKDGTLIDCLLTTTVQRAEGGTILGYNGIICDITERKAIDSLLDWSFQKYQNTLKDISERKELEEMWRRYEFIVNTSKEFMTLVSRDYRYEAANEAYCSAQNKRREEIVGKTAIEVWGEERYAAIKESFEECFAGNEVHFQGWFGFSDLGNRYMDVTYYPYYNSEDIVTHAVVVSRDITERAKAEKALQHAHAQNEQLLASISSILIGVDSNDLITHWNKPAEEAFGILAKDVITKPFLECGIQWDWFEILKRIGSCREQTRATHLDDVTYTRPDGKEGFLNVTVNPFSGQDQTQTGFLLVGEDVTARKVLESQLGHAQKLESIGQLAAGIAHEINTPTQYVGDNIRFLQESFEDISAVLDKHQQLLTTVGKENGFAGLIAEIEQVTDDADMEFLMEEIPTAITQSLEGIDHVSGIVRAMKEFSHPGVEEKTAIDINKAIESTITVARNEWKYVADIETDFDANLPPVPCLAGEFNQVILNMIINATHAIVDAVDTNADEKGIITLSTCRDDDWVEIKITDTGTGIPEKARPKIFDPFFTTKDVGKGTGQGLSISHAVIVEKHQGTISFETEMGQGTTFIIRLPLDTVAINGEL